MNSRSVGFPGSGGGLSQSKLNNFILKECNLHSRRLLSPLIHFSFSMLSWAFFLSYCITLQPHTFLIDFSSFFVLLFHSFLFHLLALFFLYLCQLCIFPSSFLPINLTHLPINLTPMGRGMHSVLFLINTQHPYCQNMCNIFPFNFYYLTCNSETILLFLFRPWQISFTCPHPLPFILTLHACQSIYHLSHLVLSSMTNQFFSLSFSTANYTLLGRKSPKMQLLVFTSQPCLNVR